MASRSAFVSLGGYARGSSLVDGQPARRSRRGRLEPACCSREGEKRELDARGFQVPMTGEVVTFAGKWPGEEKVGLIESVQYIKQRAVYVVDVMELKSVGPSLFTRPSSSARSSGPTTKWMDVGEVRLVPDAEKVKNDDTYRVRRVNDGYQDMSKLDPDIRKKYNDEYEELKQSLFQSSALTGAVGTVFAFLLSNSSETASTFAVASVSGLVYLSLLNRRVDQMGDAPSGLAGAARMATTGARFLTPVIPFALLYSRHDQTMGVDRSQVLAAALGFLSYKLPIFARSLSELVDSLADADPVQETAISTMVVGAAKALRKNDGNSGQTEREGRDGIPIIFCGPSGVGKSTLIERLLEKYPESFGYSVSHTTRPPRADEQDGMDYNFTTVNDFKANLDDFIEYAEVHGNYYGTSFSSLFSVIHGSNAKNCLLDLDVQGVQALNDSGKVAGLYIWVAPPSLEVLRDRLGGRETESETAQKLRMANATREMSFAATSGLFEYTLVNDNFEATFAELEGILARYI